VAAGLIGAAQAAFTQALQLAATISAAVAAGAGILAMALLRRVPMGSELGDERGPEPARAVTGGRRC